MQNSGERVGLERKSTLDTQSCQLDIQLEKVEEAIVRMSPEFTKLIKAANTQIWSDVQRH